MTVDNPDNKNDKWTQLVARVTAWLLLPFWSETDEQGKTYPKRDFQKQALEMYIEDENNTTAEDKKNHTSIINAVARKLKEECAMPSGSKPKDPTVAQIWDMVRDNPNRILALLTLRENKVKVYGEASKIAQRRIKSMLKEMDIKGEDVPSQFIDKFDEDLVAYPVKQEEKTMDEEA
jgi:signal recognition particle subunit SEC65